MEGPGIPEGAEQFGNIIVVMVRKVDREEHIASQKYRSESWRATVAVNQVSSTSAPLPALFHQQDKFSSEFRTRASFFIDDAEDLLLDSREKRFIREEKKSLAPISTAPSSRRQSLLASPRDRGGR